MRRLLEMWKLSIKPIYLKMVYINKAFIVSSYLITNNNIICGVIKLYVIRVKNINNMYLYSSSLN